MAPWRTVAERASESVGRTSLQDLEARVATLEEAVAENARLAGPLREYLASIEGDLVRVLRAGPGDSGDSGDPEDLEQ